MSMARVLLPWVGLLSAIFLVIFAVPTAIEGLKIASDAPNYVSTRAKVRSQFEKEHKLGSTSVVEFSYRIDGRKYFGSNEVTVWADDEKLIKSLIRKEKDGQKTMLVWYDPDQPKRAVIRQDVPMWPHLAWLAITAVVALWSMSSVVAERKRKALVARAKRGQPESRPLLSAASKSSDADPASSDGSAP